MPRSFGSRLGATRLNLVDCHVGGRVRATRMSARLSVDALAKKLGVTEEMFRRYERGEVRLRAVQLFTLSDELGVPLKTFFEEARPSRSGNVTYLRRWFN